MSKYEDRLKERKAQFMERAFQRLSSMRENLTQLAADAGQEERWRLVMKEFHQLAAAAGIYEIDELASLAVTTEDMLIKAHGASRLPGPPEIDEARRAIDVMERVLRASSSESRTRS